MSFAYPWTAVGARSVRLPDGSTQIQFYRETHMPDTTGEKPADFVPSTSDARTVNNTMRHQYRVLDDAEKALMNEVKTKGAEFVDLLHQIGGTGHYGAAGPNADPERFGSRNLALAFGHIEDAVYRAVKHITA